MNSRAGIGLALFAILGLGAVFRFAALGWGLRHEPDWDERVFVQSAAWVAAAGDLDHRFYEYPGLAVYLLVPAVAPHDPPEVGPPAYLAARRLVAAFGMVSVALAFVLGRRLGGAPTGLAAALVLAVSPLDIQTSHMVRPDVLLGAFFLAALLVFDAAPSVRRGDWMAGAAIGAATAVKFTGVLLVPSFLVRRWSAPGDRAWGTVRAGLASAIVFAALSPYSILGWRRFAEGIATQWTYHYGDETASRSYLEKVLHDLRRLEDSFGMMGALLVVAGVYFAFRGGRRFWPALVLPPVVVGMMATADVQWPRFLVPITGVLAVLAGGTVAAVAARFGPAAAVVVALSAAIPPAVQSARYVRALQQPSAQDRALDWIEAHAEDGARILTSVKGLGLDRNRFEVVPAEPLGPDAARWAAHMDFVVSGPFDTLPPADFDVARVEDPHGVPLDMTVRVLVPKASVRPAYARIPLEASQLSASENGGEVPRLVDGDLATFWRTAGPQVPGESWIEARLPRRQAVGRIVLALGRHWRREPRFLHVFVRDGDGPWRRVKAMPGRAPAQQQPLPVSERSVELVLDPQPATAVRLLQVGRAGKHWNVAELRLDAVP